MRNKRRQRGAAALEFGLAFVVFLSVVYGVMEFGRIVSSYNILSAAVREGVRYAVVHGGKSGSPATAADIQSVVRRWTVGLDSSSVAVTATWTPNNQPGSSVRVTGTYTLTPFTGLIVSSPMTLTSSSQMSISQ
jgi:Flp pilus assembly protein TadG